MIIGAIGSAAVHRLNIATKSESIRVPGTRSVWIGNDEFQVAVVNEVEPSSENREHTWVSEDGNRYVAWMGKIFGIDGHHRIDSDGVGAILSECFMKQGSNGFQKINGSAVIINWDAAQGVGFIGRDKMGIHQVFHCPFEEGLFFSSRISALVGLLPDRPGIHIPALLKFLTFCYNPGSETFYEGIRRLRPSHYIELGKGKHSVKPYWKVEFQTGTQTDESVIAEEIRERLRTAVEIRMRSNKPTGVFLSGGLDSSGVTSLLSREGQKNLRSYSFRCSGESFDESSYAKIVADTFGTKHTVVEYRPEDVLLIEEIVSLMDEPFCDLGINVATYLLGKSAAGDVVDVFTGDGGDELFGGHPVYLADRVARVFDAVPNFLISPFIHFGKRLKDSDQKKDWRVKLGRFARSYSFPAALETHRWRVYYDRKNLTQLFKPDYLSDDDLNGVFKDAIEFNRESDTEELLSRSLYSDYQTVVQFYLRRLELIESMGLQPRFPMLDHDIVRFCATLSDKVKIRGLSDTKYIEKKVLEPWLPHEIVYRKDKLGHSIPMKNWMRDHKTVQDFMKDVLSSQSMKNLGIFRMDSVEEMIEGHRSRRHNYSHRLWALIVLQLWLDKANFS